MQILFYRHIFGRLIRDLNQVFDKLKLTLKSTFQNNTRFLQSVSF